MLFSTRSADFGALIRELLQRGLESPLRFPHATDEVEALQRQGDGPIPHPGHRRGDPRPIEPHDEEWLLDGQVEQRLLVKRNDSRPVRVRQIEGANDVRRVEPEQACGTANRPAYGPFGMGRVTAASHVTDDRLSSNFRTSGVPRLNSASRSFRSGNFPASSFMTLACSVLVSVSSSLSLARASWKHLPKRPARAAEFVDLMAAFLRAEQQVQPLDHQRVGGRLA